MILQRALGFLRLTFAVLTLAAVGTQLFLGFQRETFNLVNFFSFFTVQSNVIAAAVFFVTGLSTLRGHAYGGLGVLRGAATLYMTTTGVIYFLLLRGLEASLQTPVPWVNTVLHYVMPLAVLADWLIAPPEHRITFRRAAVWLLYPLGYVLYSLVRGAVVNWYPYPFLNANENSYAQIGVTALVMFVGLSAVTAILATRTRGRVRRRARTGPNALPPRR